MLVGFAVTKDFALHFDVSSRLQTLEFRALLCPARAVIRHIVVDRQQRGHGLGRAMVEAAARHWGLVELEAETDREAVDFYRRCGFRVQSLGEKVPGTERFRCVLGGGQQAG